MRNESKEKRQSALGGILAYAGKKRGQMSLAVALSVLSVFCGLVPYVMVALLLSGFLAGSMTLDTALWMTLGALGGWVGKALLHTVATMCSHKAAFEIIRNIRCAIMAKMARLPMGTIQGQSSGQFKQVIIDEAEKLEYPLAHVIPELTSSVLIPVTVAVALFTIDWRMGLASLASTVLGLIIYFGMSVGRAPMMQKYMQANADMNGTIVEYIGGMEVVKAFGRTAESMGKFQSAVLWVREMTLKWYRHCWPFMSVSQAIMPSTMAFVLPVGILLLIGHSITLAQLIVCIILSLGIVGAIQKVMEFMDNLVAISQVQPKVQQLLDMEELPRAKGGEMPTGNDIALNDVHFTYDKEEVIHGISFTATAGSTTALVGPSGSGKSTLAKLIARFWDVGEGTITFGGVDIRDIPLEALMEKISYVSQDNFLFNKSLAENIRVGRPGATDAEVRRAAAQAGCDEFIARFKDGYDTNAGDAGERLSGGERQRIALARAIIKDAPIVVLDEATAFTDPESEDKLQRSIDRLTKGKTLIVIAHRLSTVMFADNILVLEAGRIRAKGTHEQLLESSPLYGDMWRAHTRAADWKVKEEVQVPCGA